MIKHKLRNQKSKNTFKDSIKRSQHNSTDQIKINTILRT